MNNFKKSGPGGLRNRPSFAGGRPKSDADYSTKKKFGGKPQHGKSGGERRETEMFKTTCTTCGKAAEVPFRPDGSKPVLCRDCFANKPDDRGGKRDRFSNDRGDRKPERNFDSPRPDRGPSPDYKALLVKVNSLEGKVNEILTIIKATPVVTPTPEVKSEVEAIPTKVRKPKKVVVKKVAKKVVKKAAKKKVAKKVAKKK